jgi:hypothetical protein
MDPTEPHTVTFGTEPANFIPTTQVHLGTPKADGTLTGTINSTSQFLNSGFLQAQAPDRLFSPQLPRGRRESASLSRSSRRWWTTTF